ncbi:ATP-binding protein [Actinomyces viscosus]|uniref:Vgb family protein n=1 Tax=Actinomyces viscosus TaxID=1656 RepID=UPI000F846D1C|nr:ATP-binding protein [Actinomyces viscosus]TFH52901.1 ATP-binding protein [Actinomyces viscosus]
MLSLTGLIGSAAHAADETPGPTVSSTATAASKTSSTPVAAADAQADASGIDVNAPVTPVPGTTGEPGSVTGVESSIAPGLYQTAYSPSRNSLYVTSAVGRPPVTQSSLIKLDADTLAYQKHVVPEVDPTATGRDGKPLEGARYAVYGVAVDDEHGTVWVTNTRQSTVAVYDADTLALVKQFDKDIVSHSRDVIIDAARDRAYVSSARSNKIAVFDTSTNTQLADITVGQDADDFSPMSLALDEASGTLVTVSASSAKAALIDVASGAVTEVALPAGASRASGVAYNAATGRIYVASQGSGDLVVVEKDGTVVNQVVTATGLKDAEGKDISSGALNVALDPAGSLVYVTNRNAGTITVHDLDGRIKQTIDAGRNPNHVEYDGRGNVYAVNKGGSRDGSTKNDYVQRFSVVAAPTTAPEPTASSSVAVPTTEASAPSASSSVDAQSARGVESTGTQGPGAAAVAAAGSNAASGTTGLASTGASWGGGVLAVVLLTGGVLLVRARRRV